VGEAIESTGTWAYQTPVAEWVRSSAWAVPTLSVAHLFGLIVLLGSLFMIALRCFGLAWRRDAAGTVVRALAPATVWGLLLNTFSGSMLFAAGADRYVASYPLQIKMYAYVAGVLVLGGAYMMAAWEQVPQRVVTPRWMLTGGLLFLIWLGVAIAGRLIAFY
jgi:hypothetical protein